MVVVVFDEFPVISLMDREGGIDEVRYPNFAALTRGATWFRNTTTVHDYTEFAVPAILTGRFPRAGLKPTFADHPQSIFTLLRGYRMEVVETETRLCPRRLCRPKRNPGATSRKRRRHPNGPLFADREASFQAFVSSIKPRSRPTLYLMHVLLPHSHWEYLPDGKYYAYTPHTIAGRRKWGHDPFPIQDAYQRHLLQVGFTDRLVGRLVRRLRRVGLYDRALLVLTADHGVSFRPGDKRRSLTIGNFPDIAFVPFFVKQPGQREGRIDEWHARTIDILPTIAGALGVRIPWPVDGTSALDPNRPTTPIVIRAKHYTFTSTPEALAVRRDETLAGKIRLFGSGNEPPGFYRIGPRPELLGRRAAALPTRAVQAGIELDRPADYRSVDSRSAFVPTSVTGELVGRAAAEGKDVAVAVDGRISAVGRSFHMAGRIWFSTLVPETSFRRGRNHVRVFFVTGAPQTPVLEPLGGI